MRVSMLSLAALALVANSQAVTEVRCGIFRGGVATGGASGAAGAVGAAGADGTVASPAGKVGATGGTGVRGAKGPQGPAGVSVAAGETVRITAGLFVGGTGGTGGVGGVGGAGGGGGYGYFGGSRGNYRYFGDGGRGGMGGTGGQGGDGGKAGPGLSVLAGGTADVWGGLYEAGSPGDGGGGGAAGVGGAGSWGAHGVAAGGAVGAAGAAGNVGNAVAAPIDVAGTLVVHGVGLARSTGPDGVSTVTGRWTGGAPFTLRVIVEIGAVLRLSTEAAASPLVDVVLFTPAAPNAAHASLGAWALNASFAPTPPPPYDTVFGPLGADRFATGPDGLTRAFGAGSGGSPYRFVNALRPDGSQAIFSHVPAGLGAPDFFFDYLQDATVGPDDRPRILWAEGSAPSLPAGATPEIWTLTPEGDAYTAVRLPRRDAWSPLQIAVGFDGVTRLLSQHGNGTLEVARVGADGSLSGAREYGPFGGLAARDFAIDPDGVLHLALTGDGNLLYLVRIATDGTYRYSGYRQEAGWTYLNMAVGGDGAEQVGWVADDNWLALWSVRPDGTFRYNGFAGFPDLRPIGIGTKP